MKYECRVVNFSFTLMTTIFFSGLFFVLGKGLFLALGLPIFVFVWGTTWFNIYYFAEEGVYIIYPFRFIRNNFYITYRDIEKVIYKNKAGNSHPILYFKFKKGVVIARPTRELIIYKFVKIKMILTYLKKKGVSIEIDTDTPKERKMLE